MKPEIRRRKTWKVELGNVSIGDDAPIAVQSMCATRTQDIEATSRQIAMLDENGADVIRVAVDSKKDVEALSVLRKQTSACLAVDLQENYRLCELVAPYVQKIRYNPGHLHHHEKNKSVKQKVAFIVDVARRHNLAIRIGVNFGSIDPFHKETHHAEDGPMRAALKSVEEHVNIMDDLRFRNFLVSLKSSDPNNVIAINRSFAERYSEIPLHLGVTEAGMLPMGEVKSRVAFENLLAQGIGDTLRVSLTLPFSDKYREVLIGKQIMDDVYNGRFRSVPVFQQSGLNIISCPSCSRVENEAFVELAEKVREISAFAANENITIAVMGCRVNGPGETDEADIGLWCAPRHVNLKRKDRLLGSYSYEEILPRVVEELEAVMTERGGQAKSESQGDVTSAV